MKRLYINTIIFTILAAGLFMACEKNDLRLTQFDLPGDKGFVKFAMFSPPVTGAITSVMIKVNDIKVNGATTPVHNGYFPAVGLADYAAVVPNGTFKLSLPNIGTGNDSVVLFTGPLSIDSGKFYTVVLADTGSRRTLFSVPDEPIATPDSGFANIRLVNASPNAGPLNFVFIDSVNPTTVRRDTIARNIDFKGNSPFIRVPFGTFRYRVITAGGAVFAANNSVNVANRRSATIFSTGFIGGTGNFIQALTAPVLNQ
jgi:hypothetical protein